MKEIVVEGCEFYIYENGKINLNGDVTVDILNSVISDNSKVDGKGIFTTLKVNVNNFTSTDIPGWEPGSGATTTPAEIISTAQYDKVDGFPVILEGDEAINVPILGTVKSGTQSTPKTAYITIKVKSAGQTSTKGE